MAKTNAKTTEKVVEQPETDVQPIQTGTGDINTAPGTQAAPEGGEEELQVQQGQSGSEQTTVPGSAGLDTESESRAAEEEGGGLGDQDQVTDELDEPTETIAKRNRIAKDVFEKNPQCMVLHFTADLIPFFNKSDAFRHGTITLKNGVIVTIKRK